MHVISATNVRDALPEAMNYLEHNGDVEDTRQGPALVAPGPVTIHYQKPKEHVLLDPARDANPFFHLMEAMWMLAGMEDGTFLDHYIKDFSKTYGDPTGIIPDAYGFRWRYGAGFDQLKVIIKQLKRDYTTRQCVLQMWGAGTEDLLADGAKPCNLTAAFRVRNSRLHMMVTNRSNDLVWGCCGANAVHFPLMQEYVAMMAGLELGEYWQVTNNLHLYSDHLEKINKRGGLSYGAMFGGAKYGTTQPLVDAPKYFDEDLDTTIEYINGLYDNEEIYTGNMSNLFLLNVVIPMATAHWLYKREHDMQGAVDAIETVKAEDWKQAGKEWLARHV